MAADHTDVLIVGAGPAGLFAGFYVGMRGLSFRFVDPLPEPGGQLTALYPEKYIYDVAGFPKVYAKDLVKGLVDLCRQLGAKVVAEGVETVGELHACIDCGAQYVQGYLLARPAYPHPSVRWPGAPAPL